MNSSISIRTLTDGGQQPGEIAREIAGFVSAAKQSLDLAQYDFHLGEETSAVVPDLMHHKFVVRDGETVWAGSTNWTDDSWSRQENVVVTVASPELARAFTLDFDELWRDGDVEVSGLAAP